MCKSLVWKEENKKIICSTPVFEVGERLCRSPDNKVRTYTVLDTHDWAIVIPALDTKSGLQFVMVRQWRHGARELSLEFPGGVFKNDEDSAAAALRELREETGYKAGKITKLGKFNPNPAIMSNTVHFFLCEELVKGSQELDDDEYVEVVNVPWEEVFYGLGKAPYIHALMGTAMALYIGNKKPELP
ncbi:MAG: NUDIX hydrolase [Treponema sp.]|nr:NUDIX hydrolase [Treponema sp.]